jgi:hypothetical protein
MRKTREKDDSPGSARRKDPIGGRRAKIGGPTTVLQIGFFYLVRFPEFRIRMI